MPDLIPANLTPQEQAEFDKSSPPPPASQQTSVLQGLSAPELAELAVKDKDNFDLVHEFRQNQDLWNDPAVVQKVADAHNLLRQRGFKFADLPGPAKIAGQVKDVALGMGKQAWNYAAGAVNTVMGAVAGGDIEKELDKDTQQRVAENFSGTEQAVTGLANMAEKGVRKVFGKNPAELTPDEKLQDLWSAVGKGENEQDIAKGHGAFMQAVGGNVISDLEKSGQGVRPEEVAKLAPGDPFSFWAFGKGMEAAGAGIKAVTPAAVSSVIQKGADLVNKNAAPVVGKTIEAAGDLTQLVAKKASSAGKTVLPVAGAIVGGVKGGPLGILPGIAGGQVAAKTVSAAAKGAETFGGKAASFGEQVAGAKPIVSPYAQLTRDLAEAAPHAIGSTLKGVATDVGLAAVTAENPHDTEGVGLGAAIGALHGAGGALKHAVSGQIIAPRAYGNNSPVSSSGAFPALDAMHTAAVKSAAPGVTTRLNAVREFLKSAAPGTDVFLAPDDASLKSALEQTGMTPEQAQGWADQEGFFTANLPGKDGQPRRVIVAKNIEAAPHEAFHAIQDVLGESANREIDELVKKSYAGQWDYEGQKYARRLDASNTSDWRDVILDHSGWGRSDAVEKLMQQAREASPNADIDTLKSQVNSDWDARLSAALKNNPNASMDELQSKVWRDVLTPEEAKATADRYIARELAAENFDMVFKHGPEGKSVPEQFARIVAKLTALLGGDALSDRRSDIGGLNPKLPVVEAVRKAVPTFEPAPQVKPEVVAPKPRGAKPAVTPPAPPGTPAPTEAREIADAAPAEVPPGKTASPKELLGTVAEAIAQQSGVKINYHSAPGEPAAATSSNRDVRREIIEAFRDMPKSARALWEKNFFPDKIIKTKGGEYQVQGWAPEVFAANAHKLASVLAEVDPKLSPYEIDKDFNTFTEAGWRALYEDAQTFVKNQMSGRTGSGEELVVPKALTEKGVYAPQVKSGSRGLDQTKADFINLLFNFRLPETPRVQKGKLPLNIVGQEVSEATKPGRTEIPVRPRGEFTGAAADELGIAGRHIEEVNPLRQEIERAAQAAGKALPSMVEVIQKLNLSNINDVTHAPEQPQFRGNTLTLSAGFQPKTSKGRELEGKGYEFKHTGFTGSRGVTVSKDGSIVGEISSQQFEADPKRADVAMVYVDKAHRQQDIGETLYRELASTLQKDGITELRGTAVSPGPLKIRNKVFGGFTTDHAKDFGSFKSVEATSKIEPNAQYQPGSVQEAMDSMKDPEAWKKITSHPPGKFGGGLTGWAYEQGAKARTPEDLAAFKSSNQIFSELSKQAMANKDFDLAMNYMGRAQAAHEAYQAATGVNFNGEAQGVPFIQKHYDANYKPPLPVEKSQAQTIDNVPGTGHNSPMIKTETKGQSQPKRLPEVADLADEYAKDAGIDYAAPTGHVEYDRDLGKRIAKFYHEAEHSPEDPKVQKSYDAFKQEVLAQYKAIEAAGYDLEPVLSVESPYKNGSEVAKDVEDNKHLAFNLSESGFGQEGQGAHQLMLEPTGVKAHGKELNYNDMFRAIHDFFGHAKEGLSFGPRGEFNAWREHSALFSEAAQGALAVETIGQTAWTQLNPSLLNTKGVLLRPNEKGFVPRTDRPYAPQKNLVMPSNLLNEARGQAQPAKADEKDFKLLRGGPDGFSKSWILPDGKPVQLGAQYHSHWLAEDADGIAAAKKYGIKVPAFDGQDTENVREDALKKGFVRLNYSRNTGTLVVEARAKDWPSQVDSVRQFAESNISDLDNIKIALLDPKVERVVNSNDVKLFEHDDADKIEKVPLLNESAPTSRKELPVGAGETLRPDKSYNPNDNYFKTQAQPKNDYESEPEVKFDPETLDRKLVDGSAMVGAHWLFRDGRALNVEGSQYHDDYATTMSEITSPGDKSEHPSETFQYDTGAIRVAVVGESPAVIGDDGGGGLAIALSKKPSTPQVKALIETLKQTTGGFRYDHVPLYDTVSVDIHDKSGEVVDGKVFNWPADQGKFARFIRNPFEGQAQPKRGKDEALALPGMEFNEFKPKEIADMTKDELAAHFPESVVPRTAKDLIDSNIVGSPVYKKAGSEEKAVEAFAQKMVKFAKESESNPVYNLGKKWYSEFAPLLKKEFGADAPLMAELLAATSPQTSVETNFGYAFDALQGIKSGRFDKTIAKFKQGLSMLENDAWLGWYNKELKAGNIPEAPASPTPAAFLAAFIDKHDLKPTQSNGKLFGQHSLAVLKVFARRWMDLNAGPKTRNFVANLLGEGHEATIDLWADRTMRRLGYADDKARWRILPKNQAGVSDADFAFAQKVFRKAADELKMNADDLQGALWFAEKQLWSDRGWGRLDLGDFRKEMEKIPLLKHGYQHRLAATRAAEKTKAAEQIEIQPRAIR